MLMHVCEVTLHGQHPAYGQEVACNDSNHRKEATSRQQQ